MASPHLPFDLILVCTFGLIFKVFSKNNFNNTLLNKTIININDIHHQYCQTVSVVTTEELYIGKCVLKSDLMFLINSIDPKLPLL
jgi:hypothetical protein